MTPRETYETTLGETRRRLKHVSGRVYALGSGKLLVVALIVAAIIYFWGSAPHVAEALVPLIIVFLILAKWQDKRIREESYLKKKAEVCTQEMNALQGDVSEFSDGKEYVDERHFYTFDIDIFGEGSLFQNICRCSTSLGKRRLAEYFMEHLTATKEILSRQEAVRELATYNDFRMDFRIRGLLAEGRSDDEESLLAWAGSKSLFTSRRYLRILPWIVAAVNILLFGSALLGWCSWLVPINVWALLALSSFMFSGRITKAQGHYDKSLKILSTYADLIHLIEKGQWKAGELRAIHSSVFAEEGPSASEAIGQLSKLMNALDNRGNLLMLIVRNGLYYWELHQIMAIERWREQNALMLPSWLEAIGRIDALNSLGTFCFNHPSFCFPEPVEGSFRLEGKDLGHPLMATESCVCNPVELSGEPSFMIVTGANMAGKSTYLRTVAVNYLLACIGATVYASSFRFTPGRLITSLRTSDSLRAGESYFFAELKRLKLIIDLLQKGEKLFILLDEILRGTNSVDKQKGSYSFIRQLMMLKANGIIATHDLQLATLTKLFPDGASNYCFEADIVDNELHFSYHLRPGVAQNMNACFLMRKMGIDVVDA